MSPSSNQYQSEGQGRPASGRWLTAAFAGIGYSVEVILRQKIGERRCRDMGLPLLIVMVVSFAVTVLALGQKRAYPTNPGLPQITASGQPYLFPNGLPERRTATPTNNPFVVARPATSGPNQGQPSQGRQALAATSAQQDLWPALLPLLLFFALSLVGHTRSRLAAWRRR